MHDIRAIRENPAAFDAALARRGVSDASSGLLKVDGDRRAAILAAETAQAEQNKASKEVGAAKGRGDEAEFERLRALVAEKKAEVAEMNALAKELDEALTDALARLPNLPHDDVPVGEDEADNVEIHRWGSPRGFDFQPVEHYQLAATQGGMDFETAVRERIPILSILLNNFSMAIELHIMQQSTEKYRATDISGDYAAMARAFGGYGEAEVGGRVMLGQAADRDCEREEIVAIAL